MTPPQPSNKDMIKMKYTQAQFIILPCLQLDQEMPQMLNPYPSEIPSCKKYMRS